MGRFYDETLSGMPTILPERCSLSDELGPKRLGEN
jgi:hypothetical protein